MTNNSLTNKTLFGRVKIDLIPNVSDFNTFIKSYSEFAAIFGLKSPNRKNTLTQFNELKKANKYIVKQNNRLMKYAQTGRMAEHDYLMKIILEKSDAFLVMSIHHKATSNKGKGPLWYQQAWSKTVSLVNRTRRVSKGDIPLEFKRVWIDKKPGDYARPLGAVKRWWATYTFNINRQIEHVLHSKNMLTEWQHGGRAFKGTHTAWEKVMFVLKEQPYIYEFDIKGFYDNIITENVAPFLGKEMEGRVQKIVNTTRPTEFKLPPSEMLQSTRDNFGIDPITGQVYATQSRWDLLDRPDLSDVELYNAINSPSQLAIKRIQVRVYLSDGTSYDKWIEQPSPQTWEGPAHDWAKGLSKVGRGFPQGLSFSPILSTNLLERALPEVTSKNLTMYMDDGLIYGQTKAEVLQIITKLEAALDKLGITLAPEKSGWVREDWIFKKSSKFLAIRVKEDGTLVSETRGGTSRNFPNPLTYEDYTEFCENLEINASTSRITYKEIYEPKGLEYIIWMGNCMGNILNYMYAPQEEHNEQEQKNMGREDESNRKNTKNTP